MLDIILMPFHTLCTGPMLFYVIHEMNGLLQVIYQLKKRCGELSEEELGKLSVQLLNCQSEVEQRPIFKCSADMVMLQMFYFLNLQ